MAISRRFLSRSVSQTRAFARRLAPSLRVGDVLVLSGGLGSGKTTFTQALGKTFGISGRIRSSSFVLVTPYRASRRGVKNFYHVDLFRLRSLSESDREILKEIFRDRQAITVIEWAARAGRWVIPQRAIRLRFSVFGPRVRQIVVRRP